MRDGIYRLVYAGISANAFGLFVIRNGEFRGVGQSGAEYEGTIRFEPSRNLFVFDGSACFKPGTQMVIGGTAGDDGLTLPFKGEMSNPDPSTRFSLAFANRAVDVAMDYVSPLPG